MRRTDTGEMRRLQAATPTFDLRSLEESRAATWRTISAEISVPTRRSPGLRRRGGFTRRRIARAWMVLVPALLAGVGVAFAAGAFQVGSPAKVVEQFESPSASFGTVVASSVRVLAVTAPDPEGGPPWGLRVFDTSRGAGCVQAGRLVNGQIGVLGEDGAFGDDGRFHALPVASTNPLTCVALDANGRIFQNVSKSYQLANALSGPEQAPTEAEPRPQDICVSQLATPAERSSARGGRVCPLSQERNLYYGLLGPQAKSITYTSDGRTVTAPVQAPDGAYLIVTGAGGEQRATAFGPGATGVVPIDSPISEIEYADGSVCRLSGQNTAQGACTTPMSEPVGYAPVGTPPSASQVAAPLSASLSPVAGGREVAHVSFTAHAPVDGMRSQYKIEWRQPAGQGSLTQETASQTAVSEGQEVHLQTLPLSPGTAEVMISLQYATGPELLEGPGTIEVPVGRTTVTVP
jgi:hypothetical protein